MRPRDLEERWILARLDATRAELEDGSGARSTSRTPSQALYRLTFDDFCDWYAEAIKPRLYERDDDALATALAALERLLKLLHPVMPHVTEEIWSHLPARESRLIVAPWPEPDERWAEDADALERGAGRGARSSGAAASACALEGDDERIFEAVVRPDRVAGERQRRGGDRAPARRGRARAEEARERAVRRASAPPEVVEAEREKLARYRAGARCARRLTGSSRSRPWPEEFGLERMRRCSPALGEPQRAYPSIHVVGTNGKSTATRTIEELLAREGLRVGAYLSPHVSGWASASASTATRRTSSARSSASARTPRGATQFEALTAAALAEFAAAEVDVAVVEAGLGGRLDATNVVDAPVVLLTNVALEHTEVLGETREAIAREKLAVARPARRSCSASRSGRRSSPELPRRRRRRARGGRGVPRPAGRARGRGRAPRAGSSGAATDLWDGAHTPEAADWLLARLPRRDYVALRLDPRATRTPTAMLARARHAPARTLVATALVERPRAARRRSSRACAGRTSSTSRRSTTRREALERARELAGRTAPFSSPARSTCSRICIAVSRTRTMTKLGERLSVLAFAPPSSPRSSGWRSRPGT